MQAHQEEFPIRQMCKVLVVSSSGYYAWRERPESIQAQANRKLVMEIRAIHARSRGNYGSPRVHADLQLRGFRVGRNRIARLMRLEKIYGRRRTKKIPHTTNSQHEYPVAPNRLNRNFQASRPNEKWLADIYLYSDGGRLVVSGCGHGSLLTQDCGLVLRRQLRE